MLFPPVTEDPGAACKDSETKDGWILVPCLRAKFHFPTMRETKKQVVLIVAGFQFSVLAGPDLE